MTTTPPRINPRLGAAALRAPAASREDSRPQAILKLHHPSSLDYRTRNGLPINPLSSHPLNKKVPFKVPTVEVLNAHLSQAKGFSPV